MGDMWTNVLAPATSQLPSEDLKLRWPTLRNKHEALKALLERISTSRRTS